MGQNSSLPDTFRLGRIQLALPTAFQIWVRLLRMSKSPRKERRVHSNLYPFHLRAAANSDYGGISIPPLPSRIPWLTRENVDGIADSSGTPP